jgi:hypothetical protein
MLAIHKSELLGYWVFVIIGYKEMIPKTVVAARNPCQCYSNSNALLQP